MIKKWMWHLDYFQMVCLKGIFYKACCPFIKYLKGCWTSSVKHHHVFNLVITFENTCVLNSVAYLIVLFALQHVISWNTYYTNPCVVMSQNLLLLSHINLQHCHFIPNIMWRVSRSWCYYFYIIRVLLFRVSFKYFAMLPTQYCNVVSLD